MSFSSVRGFDTNICKVQTQMNANITNKNVIFIMI